MAAEAVIKIFGEVTGLGNDEIFSCRFAHTLTPSVAIQGNYPVGTAVSFISNIANVSGANIFGMFIKATTGVVCVGLSSAAITAYTLSNNVGLIPIALNTNEGTYLNFYGGMVASAAIMSGMGQVIGSVSSAAIQYLMVGTNS